MIQGIGVLVSSAVMLLSMPSGDHTPVARTGPKNGPRCACAATVAGPDGGTRVLQEDRSECYDTSSCTGECVYFADLPSTEPPDYPMPCNSNEGPSPTCGADACPRPRAGYTLGPQNCIVGPSCDGICVWKDPQTNDESYDVCR